MLVVVVHAQDVGSVSSVAAAGIAGCGARWFAGSTCMSSQRHASPFMQCCCVVVTILQGIIHSLWHSSSCVHSDCVNIIIGLLSVTAHRVSIAPFVSQQAIFFSMQLCLHLLCAQHTSGLTTAVVCIC